MKREDCYNDCDMLTDAQLKLIESFEQRVERGLRGMLARGHLLTTENLKIAVAAMLLGAFDEGARGMMGAIDVVAVPRSKGAN